MRVYSIKNENTNGKSLNRNFSNPKIQVNRMATPNSIKNSGNPSFGWWGVDDLFYLAKRSINSNRAKVRTKQIEAVRVKVADDIALLAKRLRISPEVAKNQYNEYLNIGGIKPTYDGKEVGLNRVIGYSLEKLELIKNVVVPIIYSQEARKAGQTIPEHLKAPNGVLLYGSSGTGKSNMANSLLEHLRIKGKEKNFNIETTVINRPWMDGDTEENISAIRTVFEEAEAKFNKDKTHSLIMINNLKGIFNAENAELLQMELAYQTKNAADKGITWISTTNSPQEFPDWFFNPSRFGFSLPVKRMESDHEISAVMSHFWEQMDRKDNTDHDKILDFARDNGMAVYPSQLKKITENIDEFLIKNKDYVTWNAGDYKAPVETKRMLEEMERYHAVNKSKDVNNFSSYNVLNSLSDESYIAKKVGKYENNK